LLGETTYDVYLNDVAYWKNIPERVWDYTIGGYQVIKKWLSYRELELLNRPLTPEEAREVMNMARRIAAIVLLDPALDALLVKGQAQELGTAERISARRRPEEWHGHRCRICEQERSAALDQAATQIVGLHGFW